MSLRPGLYEALLTQRLHAQLQGLPDNLAVDVAELSPVEAVDRLARHLAREFERALADVPEDSRVELGAAAIRLLLTQIAQLLPPGDPELLAAPTSTLRSISPLRPDGTPAEVLRPLVPLLDTTLLTRAPGEPNLGSQVRSEIDSADSIDLIMAFIRRTGIRPLLEPLRRHCQAGKRLRVLTTTYTGSTERAALDALADLGAQVRVSYDQSTTRLHAKAWLFTRPSGVATAYIGSSNLTHSAQVTGLEWNLRVAEARNPDVIAKFTAMFDAYWEGGDFVPYDPAQFDAESDAGRRDRGPQLVLSPVSITASPFQDRLLELVELSRQRGWHRNLIVAATGTGKTVMAALDYARLARALPRARLLFIAHRDEILEQSRATFRHALHDASFGEKWARGERPRDFEHVFASIQTLRNVDLGRLAADHFDVVIVDEVHHGAAETYRRLLDHLAPVELLGLTATPERSDGLSILHWFGDRIAAELRLWDAIEQQYLVPFAYYGIHDGLDLREVPWRRGQGYDVEALSEVYTSSDAWARLVLKQVGDLADPATMRCLGFCVSVSHARFMARHFTAHGVPAVAVDGSTPPDERASALRDLAQGRVRTLFSVEVFTEGVDVPTVDTVLLLRPTESPTLFLQQLGRGLRKAADKPLCTVLDFVGNHRAEFRFDRRLRALLGGSRKDVERQVEQGFPYLPAGCHLELDRVATEIVLRSLREALPSRWPEKVAELRALQRDRDRVTLATFLAESGLDLEDVYAGNRCWSDLQSDAGVVVENDGPHESALRRALGRLLHVDDPERIGGYRRLLAHPDTPRVSTLPVRDRRLLHMAVAVLADSVVGKAASLQDGVDLLWAHPQVRAELSELGAVQESRLDHVALPLAAHADVPLQVHARYSRLEILAAAGVSETAKVRSWREGVLDATGIGADLLAFTLDKSSDSFSPTTRYRDYAISRSLIHWESQSGTREDSPTGLRYRNHVARGRSILLFARLRQDDRAFWFLGPATYRGHVGERPMAVTWKLEHPLSGDLFAEFAAAVA